MFDSIDDITWNYEDAGTQTRKELEKAVLTKGAWSTIMFKFQDLNRKTEEWGPPKACIVRYQKQNGVYRKKSSFNISSEKQAKQIIETLSEFFPEE